MASVLPTYSRIFPAEELQFKPSQGEGLPYTSHTASAVGSLSFKEGLQGTETAGRTCLILASSCAGASPGWASSIAGAFGRILPSACSFVASSANSNLESSCPFNIS